MEEISTLINTLGFPISCVVVCGLFIRYMVKTQREDNVKREERLLLNNETLAKALDKSATAITESTKVISQINEKVNEIDNKVDKVLDVVSK